MVRTNAENTMLVDEVADRLAEERSEGEGMPEHREKAADPARWATDRNSRINSYPPDLNDTLPRLGMFGPVIVYLGLVAVISVSLAMRWMPRHRRNS